jgi:hypothetical protein
MSRLAKFFSAGVKTINLSIDYFRPKRDPNYLDESITPVPQELILYGVDFLGTKQIKKKFTGLDLVNVVWLDDSNCKIIFTNANDAKKGLEMNLLSKS